MTLHVHFCEGKKISAADFLKWLGPCPKLITSCMKLSVSVSRKLPAYATCEVSNLRMADATSPKVKKVEKGVPPLQKAYFSSRKPAL